MINAFRSELLKFRRKRFLLGCLGASAAVGILGSVVAFVSATDEVGPDGGLSTLAKLARFDGLVSGISLLANLLGLVALVIGAFCMAQEFSVGTIRNLLIRQPHRASLLAGKLTAVATLITACAAISCVTAIGAAFALAPIKGVSTAAWVSAHGLAAVGKIVVRVFGAQLVFGSVGSFLAILFKAPTPAISIGLAWTMLIEVMMGAVSKPISKFLPGQLASSIVEGGNVNIGLRFALIGGSFGSLPPPPSRCSGSAALKSPDGTRLSGPLSNPL
jgi:ABC-2 type transport system permease protein